ANPDLRPAWSLRAAEAPRLAVASASPSPILPPSPVSFGNAVATSLRRKTSPLDIALAMQLRPGLGAGADPAWMVRFLMAAFGWFVVVVSGN
ncbi:hypothetical protein FA15DRAFT_553300, partial [Coprinopsis marcescibilis]